MAPPGAGAVIDTTPTRSVPVAPAACRNEALGLSPGVNRSDIARPEAGAQSTTVGWTPRARGPEFPKLAAARPASPGDDTDGRHARSALPSANGGPNGPAAEKAAARPPIVSPAVRPAAGPACRPPAKGGSGYVSETPSRRSG